MPRKRTYSKHQMDNVMKFGASLPENRERSGNKIASQTLFRSGSSLSQDRQLSGLNRGQDKSAVFGDNVRAENERVREAQANKHKNIDYSQITKAMDSKITKLEQMNSKVLKMHEANQKSKQRLQEAPND